MLVGAADAVVSKPGYGIISECIANETAILYTSRGHFHCASPCWRQKSRISSGFTCWSGLAVTNATTTWRLVSAIS